MALQETKCPNCGANIVADNYQKKVTCIYCHTSFELLADDTDDSANTQENDILERAETFLTLLQKTEEALDLFNEYSMLEPADYRGWWGVARAYSDDFTKTMIDTDTYSAIEENVELALRVAGDYSVELSSKWNEYKGCLSIVSNNKPSVDSVAGTATTATTVTDKTSPEIMQKYMSTVRQFNQFSAELDAKVAKYKEPSKATKAVWASLTIFYGAGLVPLYLDKKKKKELDELTEKVEALKKHKEYMEKTYGLSEDMVV